MSKVVTRIAPSPTGRFHVGTARTALFNYLYARHAGGKFIIRIEDTDKERSTKEYEKEILDGIAWLGLTADETVRQSERIARHIELLAAIIKSGAAYISKEESRNEPGKSVGVVRLKNPGKTIKFRDEVRGDISFDTAELKDFVIARSVTDPLYHFAVVVDDSDMGVTHVIRGEDHISNTPRQILIQEALGVPRPLYAHLPLILDEKRAKLSKRSGATSVMDYRAEGVLPEALVNYLALLGWNPGDEREDFSLVELVEAFALHGIQKSGAAWNREKLLSVNQRWMRKLSDDGFISQFKIRFNLEDSDLRLNLVLKAIPLLKERARTFSEARTMLDGELSCLFSAPSVSREGLLAKEPTDRLGTAKNGLKELLKAIQGLPEGAPVSAIKAALMPLADAEEAKGLPAGQAGKGGRGAVLWPLRYALSGEERSPDPFTLIFILGRNETISRIQAAIGILG